MKSWNLRKVLYWFCWNILGGCLLCCFLFCLFLLHNILVHSSELHYFSSSEVNFQTLIRVLTGGYIIFQYLLLLFQYLYIYIFLFLELKWCSFPHSVMCCSLEENMFRLLLNPIFLEDNHRIISFCLLYLNRCNGVACYPIDVFGSGPRITLDGDSTTLGVRG